MQAEEDTQYRIPPAEGERRARVGYGYQDEVSAALIYNALNERILQWIRVTDPEAGNVDDLQIGTPNRVDAYQFKGAQYRGTFTFNELISTGGQESSLIYQLAEGWKQLEQIHSPSRVVVHLVTNRIASTSTSVKIPIGDSPPRTRHFAAFLGQAWEPDKAAERDSEWDIPGPWKPAWEALKEASGLSPEDFEAFVQDCELEFGYQPPEYGITDRERELAKRDLDDIARFLSFAGRHPRRKIQYSHKELLLELGWQDRFWPKIKHDFHVDEARYRPVEESKQQLERALSSLPGGYIAVLGTPGSGKSTLLTQTLRYRQDDRIIRYYVYVPEGKGSISQRGESGNFLEYVVIRLREAGFPGGVFASHLDRSQLLEHFHRQLELLGEDYQSNGHKTIILIDGLDYISREGRPVRSLLSDLPHPEQIPEGVYIVLGSQTDQLDDLPHQVRYEISQHPRRITMRPLSREAVRLVTNRAEISVSLSNEQKDSIFRISEGHPLALMYLLNKLKEARNNKEVDAVLGETEKYEDHIDNQYYSYWTQIQDDIGLTNLLGRLARLRRAIDLSWVESWENRAVVDRLRRSAGHYFNQENQNRWYFFHDSFRLFLRNKSAESYTGDFDTERDQALHKELAERCAQEPATPPWAWEELYHLAKAENHDQVLGLATQEWFRSQCLDFRPIGAIREDIKLAFRSAAVRKNPTAIVMIELAAAEINRREFELMEVSLAPLLLRAGEVQKAVEHVHDGRKLRVDNKEALRMSVELEYEGFTEEAHRVFELSEPLDLLAGVAPIEEDIQDLKGSLLETWAEAAVHFRDVDPIIESIQRINQSGDPFGEVDADTATNYLRNRMLFHSGIALLKLERWNDLEKISRSLEGSNTGSHDWWFWLQVHAWRHCKFRRDIERARSFLKKVLDTEGVSELSPKARVVLAEGVHSVLRDEHRTRELLEGVEQPPLQTDLISSDRGLNPFLMRLRLNRLLHILGNQESPSEIVPDTRERWEKGGVIFERAICEVARLWADGICGRRIDVSEVENRTIDLLRLFNRHWQDTSRWSLWYTIEQARGEFYSWVIDAIAKHSIEAVLELRRLFEQEWDGVETGKYWPWDVKRQIVLYFGSDNRRYGTPREWVVQRLHALEDEILVDQEIYSHVSECRKQAEAWLEVGDQGSALKLLTKMIQKSFGVGDRKDYQLDTWIQILSLINDKEPERAAERISRLDKAILSLKGVTEEDIPRLAANELIKTTFRWSPRRAVSLFIRFIDRRIVWHEEALGYLLEAALEHPNSSAELILSCITELLIPVATHQDPDLVISIIEKVANLHGVDLAIEAAKRIIENIDTNALSSTRPGWKRGVVRALLEMGVDLHLVGLEVADLRSDKHDEGSSRTLRLKDESSMNTEEVIIRASSVAELQEVLELEADNSYFDWMPVVANLVDNLSYENVLLLANLFQGKRRPAQISSLLAERLSVLGDSSGAWDLGIQALEASNRSDWSRWLGDGSRVDVFRALLRFDSERSRILLYETLEKEGGFGIFNIIEVMPLLVDDVPIREIWKEIDNYLSALLESCSLPDDGPTFLDAPPPDDTPAHAIADLIILHVTNSSGSLAQAAQRLCVNLLLQDNVAIRESIQEALIDAPNSIKELMLIVLDTASMEQSTTVMPFSDEVTALLVSPSSRIRSIACTISNRLGKDVEIVGGESGHFYDPSTLLLKPTSRPSNVVPMGIGDRFGRDYEEWIERCEEDVSLVISNTMDGLIVLAEETTLEYLEPYRPKENRQSVVLITGTPKPSPKYGTSELFHTGINILLEEYASFETNISPPPLAIRHIPYLFDSPSESWLALNPHVGRELGWTHTEDGLFKWVDSDGQIMAESIWWVDGWTDQTNYKYDEVGEGWLVVLNPDGLGIIQKRFGQLKRQVIIERNHNRGGEFIQNRSVVEEEV